jgi:hypothetical protein
MMLLKQIERKKVHYYTIMHKEFISISILTRQGKNMIIIIKLDFMLGG